MPLNDQPVLETNPPDVYSCSACGSPLFATTDRFEAGCGFPSFAQHLGSQVRLQELHTYGRHRVQLLCAACGQHLGHLFPHKHTAAKVRYCINATAITPPRNNAL